MPLSPRKARHFSPYSGEADTKEEEIIFLYKKHKNKEMTQKKLSSDTGKVSTVRLTKGTSVSKNKRTEISVSKNKKY